MHALEVTALVLVATVAGWHGVGGLADPEGRGQRLGLSLCAVALCCLGAAVAVLVN